MKTKLEPGMLVRCDDNCIYLVLDTRGRFVGVINLTQTAKLKVFKPSHNHVGFAGINWLQKGELVAKNFDFKLKNFMRENLC